MALLDPVLHIAACAVELLVEVFRLAFGSRQRGDDEAGGSYQSYPRGLVAPPLAAITYLLRLAGISWDRIDLCVCGRSMTLCREALLECVPFPADRVVEPPLPGHHLAHAYSAYGTAPFANCAVLVIDEQGHHIDGSFEKCTWYEGANGPLTLVDCFFGSGDDLKFGMLYNAFAAMTSLTEADSPAAGKLMGLAPIRFT